MLVLRVFLSMVLLRPNSAGKYIAARSKFYMYRPKLLTELTRTCSLELAVGHVGGTDSHLHSWPTQVNF